MGYRPKILVMAIGNAINVTKCIGNKQFLITDEKLCM